MKDKDKISDAVQNIKFDPTREIVITEGCLMNIMAGLAKVGIEVNGISDKIDEKDFKNLMIPIIATFVALADLYPKETRKQVLEALEAACGIDFSEIL